ncbi:uncharacterized protein LOC113231506 [Hyposmocoma kahamanoa]|uniref:uncharacterized protein LOC113231506 n=1 Tax=Hyposmocoma kahamanoa TaxID=1477025 RepID=UPI000E6DA335|nr:uncharacterized protein LOC113231506 [Hyposmocoma kahamanoa]
MFNYVTVTTYLLVQDNRETELRVVTPVVLIQEEFVLANAIEIGLLPKDNIRSNSRVLIGEHWISKGRGVRNYILHPEYEQSQNTIAIIQLVEGVSRKLGLVIRPVCPAPNTFLINPELYVIRLKDNLEDLHREIMEVTHVPWRMCREFYSAVNLYTKEMRPPSAVCAAVLDTNEVCVWNAGAALVTRDVWGRWQLLGLGVRGPGCSAPSRYIDMLSYYPWIHSSLDKFRRVTITKINNQKYVLRKSKVISTQRFGNCDEEEKKNLLYRDLVVLDNDKKKLTFATYNMTIIQSIEITCMTMEITEGAATSKMSVRHVCQRAPDGGPCYAYKESLFDVSVFIIFTGQAKFEMVVWGFQKLMKSLDTMEWKWEEGSFYDDFTAQRVEYTGPTFMTDFGYEPLDNAMWLPNYDLWTTTSKTTSTQTETEPPLQITKIHTQTETVLYGINDVEETGPAA